MPAAVIGALVAGGIGAGTQIVGAKMASNSAKKAAKTQADAGQQAMAIQQQSTNQGLDFLKQNNAQTQQAYAPYTQFGQNAMRALGGGSQPQGGGPMSALGGQQSLYQSPLVMMRAPTGEMKQVPQHQVAAYQQKGAQVVG